LWLKFHCLFWQLASAAKRKGLLFGYAAKVPGTGKAPGIAVCWLGESLIGILLI
jgi:hypothetical protein